MQVTGNRKTSPLITLMRLIYTDKTKTSIQQSALSDQRKSNKQPKTLPLMTLIQLICTDKTKSIQKPNSKDPI
jgi:hypothetical protein